MLRTTVLLLALLLVPLFSSPLRAESRDPVSTIALQLTPGLPAVGDFALFDKEGKMQGLGRFLVSFTSIYTILGDGHTAQGSCDFVYVPYKNDKAGKYAVHQMRYWIDFDKSVVHLNTDASGSELRMEFEFNPANDFTNGVVRKGLGETSPEVGSCKIRLKDPE